MFRLKLADTVLAEGTFDECVTKANELPDLISPELENINGVYRLVFGDSILCEGTFDDCITKANETEIGPAYEIVEV